MRDTATDLLLNAGRRWYTADRRPPTVTFRTMNPLVMLSSMQMQLTLETPPPHTCSVDIKECTIDAAVCLPDLARRAYAEYSKLKLPRGAVDLNPLFWTAIVVKAVEKKNGTLPNGCCTTESCPVTKFYNIVAQCMKPTAG